MEAWKGWLRLGFGVIILLALAELGVAMILLFRAQTPFESVVISLLLLVLVQLGGTDTEAREDDLKRRLIRVYAAIRGLDALTQSEQEEYQDAQMEEQLKREYFTRPKLVIDSVKLIVTLIAAGVLIKSALGL